MRRLAVLSLVLILMAAFLPFQALMEDDPISQADALYSKRLDRANLTKEIELLNGVLQSQPNHYQALCHLAKAHWYLGDRAQGKARLTQFAKGKEYAELAVKANDNGVEGHYWLASLIGCVGQEKGILNSLFMVSPMKKELDRCLALDGKYADAHDVMAQLLWKVPGFPLSIGDKKKAMEEARLGTVYDPSQIDHWLHYGQIAIDNKKYDIARTALQKALDMPDDPEDPPVSQEHKENARKALKSIEGK